MRLSKSIGSLIFLISYIDDMKFCFIEALTDLSI